MTFSNDPNIILLLVVSYLSYKWWCYKSTNNVKELQNLVRDVLDNHHSRIAKDMKDLEYKWHYRMDEYAHDAIGWQEHLSLLVKEALKENTKAINKNRSKSSEDPPVVTVNDDDSALKTCATDATDPPTDSDIDDDSNHQVKYDSDSEYTLQSKDDSHSGKLFKPHTESKISQCSETETSSITML
jgi:hypothetical protein